MFGNSKRTLFEPYGRRRSRGPLPRWLVLILLGIAIGIAGVLYAQEEYLPKRLSVAETNRLRTSFDEADAARTRLTDELAENSKRLETTLAENRKLTTDLAASRQAVAQLRGDIGSLVASLPPDPRDSPIAVRAARFSVENGALSYDVVLSRDRGGSPFGGVLQLIVAGASNKNASDTVTLKPVPVSVDRYDSVRGSLPLPAGFKPRQTTVQVLDKPGGKLVGMRVLNVQ